MRCWQIGRHGLLLGGVVVAVVDDDDVVVVVADGHVGVVGRRGHLSPRGRICRQEVACSGRRKWFVGHAGERDTAKRAKKGRPSPPSGCGLARPRRQARLLQLQLRLSLLSRFPSLQSSSSRHCSPGHSEFACSIASLVSYHSTTSRKSTPVLPHKAKPAHPSAHPPCLRTTPPASALANSRPLPRPGLSGPSRIPGPESKLSSLSLSPTGAIQYLDPRVRQAVG